MINNIVTFSDQLNRLMLESLALADVDDESLVIMISLLLLYPLYT
jgi:hypothetical protein